MRKILELCVDLDRKALDIYRGLSQMTNDPELAAAFEQMAREERAHVDWWSDLLVAWEGGLVPDIADEHDMTARLSEIVAGVEAITTDEFEGMSTDDMLDLATQLEFLMLDPIFGELVDLMQPGSRVEVREAYSRHVLRLVEAIEAHYSRPGLAVFLAGVLKRTYRDQQRLAALAVRDQLTGLFNRRGLLGHLVQWLAWSRRYNRPIGVGLLDIDYFKHINDSFGHAFGDEALRRVAAAVQRTIRSSDMVGRFGGDEFLVLAPEGDLDELQQLTERIVNAVASEVVEIDGQQVILSISAGAAWVPGGVLVTPEALVAEADRSLYGAKEAGRNRAGRPTTVTLNA